MIPCPRDTPAHTWIYIIYICSTCNSHVYHFHANPNPNLRFFFFFGTLPSQSQRRRRIDRSTMAAAAATTDHENGETNRQDYYSRGSAEVATETALTLERLAVVGFACRWAVLAFCSRRTPTLTRLLTPMRLPLFVSSSFRASISGVL